MFFWIFRFIYVTLKDVKFWSFIDHRLIWHSPVFCGMSNVAEGHTAETPNIYLVLMYTDLISVYCRLAQTDLSRLINPDCLKPPNGVAISPSEKWLTEMTPARMPHVSLWTALISLDHTEACRPYSVSLAIAIPSSISVNVRMLCLDTHSTSSPISEQ